MHDPAITHSLDVIEDLGKLPRVSRITKMTDRKARRGYPLRFDRLRLRSTAPFPDPSVSKS